MSKQTPIPMVYKKTSIAFFYNNTTHIISSDKMNFAAVVAAVKRGDWDEVVQLANLRTAVTVLSSGRVRVLDDNTFLVNDVPVHNALTDRIMAMLEDGFQVEPLLRFLDNLADNPSASAREELYLFLEACNLPITPDGHFLAWKVVGSDYRDLHSHKFDNSIGARPKMRREDCDPDRRIICSSGLHVCSESYIGAFSKSSSNHVMITKVNPRDVVAVPTDYNNSKMRVCEYEVVGERSDRKPTLTPNFTSEYNKGEGSLQSINERKSQWSETNLSCEDEEDESYDESEDWLEQSEAEVLGVSQDTIDRVRKIRKMGDDKWSIAEISRNTKVSARQVSRILRGEAWANIP